MREYEAPQMDELEIETPDVITASGEPTPQTLIKEGTNISTFNWNDEFDSSWN